MKYIFLCLSLIHLSNLWGMEEIPLVLMHNSDQVIQKFNNTIVLYSATTEYLAGKMGIYPTEIADASFGFVSKRSTSWNYQPNVIATHSIKKLISTDEWMDDTYAYENDSESLIANWSVFEGNLKMRTATPNEINAMCKVWCPDNYDFDYEEWSDIDTIANNFCCPANICCLPDKQKFMRYALRAHRNSTLTK